MTIAYRQTLPAVLVFVVLLAACGCENNARAIEQRRYVLTVRPMLRPVRPTREAFLKCDGSPSPANAKPTSLSTGGDLLTNPTLPPLPRRRRRLWPRGAPAAAASGIFSHVLDAFSGADFDYVLEGNVLALYGDYRRQDSPQAVLEIQFTLIDEHHTRDSVIFQKKYRALTDLTAQNAAQLVTGLNTCLADILTQLESDLAALPVPIE